MIDIITALINCLASLYLGYLGLFPVKGPAKDRPAASRRRRNKVIAAGVLAILATVVQAYRSAKLSDSLGKMVNTEIAFEIIPTNTKQRIEENGNVISINVVMIPVHNEAKDLRVATTLANGDGPQSKLQDQQQWSRFISTERYAIDIRSVPVQQEENNGYWNSPHTYVDSSQSLSLRDGRSTLYVMAIAKWQNASGSESKSAKCLSLVPDSDLRAGNINLQSTWKDCETDTHW